MKWMLPALLVCGTLLVAACQKTVEPQTEPITPTEEPTTDQMGEKVLSSLPTAVLSNLGENSMGAALARRVSLCTPAVTEDTELVILKAEDAQNLSNDVWESIAEVYLFGGYVAIQRPTNAQAVGIAVGLSAAIEFYLEELMEEDDIERQVSNALALTKAVSGDEDEMAPDKVSMEMIILSPCGIYTQPAVNEKETTQQTAVGQDGKETSSEQIVTRTLNPYHYGLMADGVAHWLNQLKTGEPQTKLALTKASDNQAAINEVLGCSDMFTISHDLFTIDYNGKDVRRENMGTTTIKSWSVHDFGSKQDFYYITENVEIRVGGKSDNPSMTMYWGSYKNDHWLIPNNSTYFTYDGSLYKYYYGSWLSKAEHSLELTGKGTINIVNSMPSTDNNTVSQTIAVGTSDGTSSTVGWNIGTSFGLTALLGVNVGMSNSYTSSHTNSFTMSSTQVSKDLQYVKNTRGNKVVYTYSEGKTPEFYYDGGRTGCHELAPDILTNDCNLENSVCWKVQNPQGKYTLKLTTYHQMGVMFYNNSTSDRQWVRSGLTWDNTYTLKEPCRYMGTWYCDIATEGPNRVTDATDKLRKCLQETIDATIFSNRFQAAEIEKGQTAVMKNNYLYVKSVLKEGSRVRRTIDRRAKNDWGITHYEITWYAQDPSITQEFTISNDVKK